MAGFDPDGTPRLYQTDPSGIYSAWQVNTVYSRKLNFQDFWIEEHVLFCSLLERIQSLYDFLDNYIYYLLFIFVRRPTLLAEVPRLCASF